MGQLKNPSDRWPWGETDVALPCPASHVTAVRAIRRAQLFSPCAHVRPWGIQSVRSSLSSELSSPAPQPALSVSLLSPYTEQLLLPSAFTTPPSLASSNAHRHSGGGGEPRAPCLLPPPRLAGHGWRTYGRGRYAALLMGLTDSTCAAAPAAAAPAAPAAAAAVRYACRDRPLLYAPSP